MSRHETTPLAGLLRVVFFLAVGVMGVTAAVLGVTMLYEAPEDEEAEAQFEEFEQSEEFEGLDGFSFDVDPFAAGPSEERRDYNRNVGLILGLIGTGVLGASILGLGSRHNPLRAGLLAGGVGIVLAGVSIGSDGSDDWLTFFTSGLALLTLLVCSLWLDDGYPFEGMGGGGASAGAGPGSAGEGGP